jgi:hypothetical protein
LKNFLLILLLLSGALITRVPAQDTLFVENSTDELQQRLSAVPDTQKVTDLVIFLRQPVAHSDTAAGFFLQRIYLRHRGFDRPVVFNTEGYAANRSHTMELTRILDANQVTAEHRYFGKSVPEHMDWTHLNIREAAADHHRIIMLLKQLYTGKWITTGISKGGQTAMYHRRFYPDDADATVCYVSPLNFSDREPRIAAFLKKVGDADCRSRLRDLQFLLLKKKDKFLPMYKEYANEKKYTLSIGAETAYEYSILEIPFAFWQWHSVSCGELPDSTTPADSLFRQFIRISSPYYFSDQGISYFTPFFYQALTELGYYDYDLAPFDGLIHCVTDPTYRFNAPPETNPQFNPEVMRDIADWIRTKGRHILFIYGGDDPWGASAVNTGDNPDCLEMILPGGSHSTRIRNFPPEDQAFIINTLGGWLNMQIDPSTVQGR